VFAGVAGLESAMWVYGFLPPTPNKLRLSEQMIMDCAQKTPITCDDGRSGGWW
jgi:hypothetical protein